MPLDPVMPQERKILSFTGTDRQVFLQGMITNDIHCLAQQSVLWTGRLTPQGRLQNLFFLYEYQDSLLLDCPAIQAEELKKQFGRFRLRSDVQITLTDYIVLLGPETCAPPPGSLVSGPDPRHPAMGWRAIYADAPLPKTCSFWKGPAYLETRLRHAVTDDADIVPGQTLALEANLDRLNGLSWQKGCYTGQEVTARTHYRGLVKRRLVTLHSLDGIFDNSPSVRTTDDNMLFLNNQPVGDLRSRSAHYGLAMLHRTAWEEKTLRYSAHEVLLLDPDL